MKLGYRQDERSGVMACKGNTPEYVLRMPQELFEVLAQARS
jgi:hypothetical protein